MLAASRWRTWRILRFDGMGTDHPNAACPAGCRRPRSCGGAGGVGAHVVAVPLVGRGLAGTWGVAARECAQSMAASVGPHTRLHRRAMRPARSRVPMPHHVASPAEWERLFPATGGALYGRASHGSAASFLRQGPRTRIKRLYCAGGATHPSAGVPMAALSGLLAAKKVEQDLASTRMFHRGATPGGISTRSAPTEPTPSR